LQNFWEGGGQGEKVLQLIKPRWNGYRKKWPLHMMNHMLQSISLKRLHAMRNSTTATSEDDASPYYSSDDESVESNRSTMMNGDMWCTAQYNN
jgi:hypothetical protein